MTKTKQEQTIAKQKQTISRQKNIIYELKRTISEYLGVISRHKRTIEFQDTIYLEASTTLSSLLKLLTELVELKDPYTEGHSQRVSQLSVALAEIKSTRFPKNKITLLKCGAILHDIGKIAVSDFVLNKPTLLTKLERRMIIQHVEIGFEIIEPLDFDAMIADIIHHHHESYDGSGYPDGLSGERISLASRIVKLADVYDALTTRRPYRSAYSQENALCIMERCQKQYDPRLIKIFLELVKEKFRI
jgi:putative nucleotidyltransferase with HDIG domain